MRGISIRLLTPLALAVVALSSSRAQADRNWTGPYVGANAGMGLSNGRVADPDCFFCSSDGFAERFFQFGAHAGYLKQMSSVVLGGEAQIDYGTQHHVGYLDGNDFPDDSTLTWTLAALARAGLAYQDTMFYLGAGPALSHIQGSVNSNLVNAGNPPFHYAVSYWQPGFKGVVGAEFFVGQHASVRAQYSLLMVSDRIAYLTGVQHNSFGATSRLDWVNQQSAVTLGLDWHF